MMPLETEGASSPMHITLGENHITKSYIFVSSSVQQPWYKKNTIITFHNQGNTYPK